MPIIKIKSSNQVGKVPTTSDLLEGELAVNTADKTLFTRHGESVVELGAPLVSEAEIVNNSTEKRSWSVERDNQASNQWWYNSSHKTKLDNLVLGTEFGNSLLTTTDSIAGKNLLGLSNVDNTSDLDKPISTATANALNGKFNKTGGDVNGNINIIGTGRRITGDFSNVTIANRVLFQTSVANGNTVVQALPNGGGEGSYFGTINTSDTDNFSRFLFGINQTQASIESQAQGTGIPFP